MFEGLKEKRSRIAGIPMLTSWTELFLIDRVLDACAVKGIIELGTGWGGLSRFLAFQAEVRGLTFLSLDVKDKRRAFGFPFKRADVLDNEGAIGELRDVLEALPVFLYCDNGDKPREVELYALHLHTGGVLGVDDWAKEIDHQTASIKALPGLGYEPLFWEISEEIQTRNRFWIRKEGGVPP